MLFMLKGLPVSMVNPVDGLQTENTGDNCNSGFFVGINYRLFSFSFCSFL